MTWNKINSLTTPSKIDSIALSTLSKVLGFAKGGVTPYVGDYDFTTVCNWTSTGTFTLRAYRGTGNNVVTTHYASIRYRKKGTTSWTALSASGQLVISSTGEWEVGNDWNKSGNDCLTHSYYDITAINSCTEVYFNETTLGATIGNYFMYVTWYGCKRLTSMPSGFNMPSGITTVGTDFMRSTWNTCTSLTSMSSGFNIPSGITTVGSYFIYGTWYDCASLTSMPSGFNIPSGITTVGIKFMGLTWSGCTKLTSAAYAENITFEFTANLAFGGTCPIIPDSPAGTKATPVNVAVHRT